MRNPAWHELKTCPIFFKPTFKGLKDFEFRLNDRGYKKGDYLILKEWDPKTQSYSGRQVTRKIKHIFEGYFGLPENMIILGLETI